MANAFDRSKRIGSQIQKDLALLIRDRMGDPRLAFLTISAVAVSKDYSHAKVYFRLMGETLPDTIAATEKILNQASRFLRKELGQGMRLRVVPNLHFHYDSVIDHGERIEKLIAAAVSEDQQNHLDDEPF